MHFMHFERRFSRPDEAVHGALRSKGWDIQHKAPPIVTSLAPCAQIMVVRDKDGVSIDSCAIRRRRFDIDRREAAAAVWLKKSVQPR